MGLATVLLDKPFVASCKTQECTCFLPMSDFLARVPTSHNNPAPKEGEGMGGKVATLIRTGKYGATEVCTNTVLCSRGGGGGYIEYRILADSAPWLN